MTPSLEKQLLKTVEMLLERISALEESAKYRQRQAIRDEALEVAFRHVIGEIADKLGSPPGRFEERLDGLIRYFRSEILIQTEGISSELAIELAPDDSGDVPATFEDIPPLF